MSDNKTPARVRTAFANALVTVRFTCPDCEARRVTTLFAQESAEYERFLKRNHYRCPACREAHERARMAPAASLAAV